MGAEAFRLTDKYGLIFLEATCKEGPDRSQ